MHRHSKIRILRRELTKCTVKMKHLSRNFCSRKTLSQSKNLWTWFRITCRTNQLQLGYRRVIRRKRKKYLASRTIKALSVLATATTPWISSSIIKVKAWAIKTTLSNKWGFFRLWWWWKEVEILRLSLIITEEITCRFLTIAFSIIRVRSENIVIWVLTSHLPNKI